MKCTLNLTVAFLYCIATAATVAQNAPVLSPNDVRTRPTIAQDEVRKEFIEFLQSATFQDLDKRNEKVIYRESKATLVFLWASWNQFSKDESKILSRLHTEYERKGLRIVGLNIDDESTGIMKKFKRDNAISYTLGSATLEFTRRFLRFTKFAGIPQSVLISSDGVDGVYLGAAPDLDRRLTDAIASIFHVGANCDSLDEQRACVSLVFTIGGQQGSAYTETSRFVLRVDGSSPIQLSIRVIRKKFLEVTNRAEYADHIYLVDPKSDQVLDLKRSFRDYGFGNESMIRVFVNIR